jgi:hypothetical protein
MQSRFINDPKHWRERAQEARVLADRIDDKGAQQLMLGIARDYERLAQRAEQRAQGLPHTFRPQPTRGD